MSKKFCHGKHSAGAGYKYADAWVQHGKQFGYQVVFDVRDSSGYIDFHFTSPGGERLDSVKVTAGKVRKFAKALLRLADEVDPPVRRPASPDVQPYSFGFKGAFAEPVDIGAFRTFLSGRYQVDGRLAMDDRRYAVNHAVGILEELVEPEPLIRSEHVGSLDGYTPAECGGLEGWWLE